jgi:hypothetical protein
VAVWLLLAGALVLGGCPRSEAPSGPAADAAAQPADGGAAISRPPPGARPVPFAMERACSADSDCVRARAQCCGCEAGGRGTAVNRRSLAAWHARLDGSCGETMCPQVMSQHPSCTSPVACRSGQCETARSGRE